MKKFLIYLIAALITLAGLLRLSLEFESGQDTVGKQVARVAMSLNAAGIPEPDGLRVFVCGSASPLGASNRAQACIAVLTPSHFYIVDLGAGSSRNISGARLPLNRLNGVLLSHFHSDHIAELYEINLSSWVQGRPEPLQVYGPKGIRNVVGGINDTYAFDRQYRTDHHGAELLPPHLGILEPRSVRAGAVLEDGDLKITAYTAAHHPVDPALGFRFDYRGRSVVISGDSLVTDATREISNGADLLIHDALSEPTIQMMAEAADQAGLGRIAKIIRDVLDYHASTDSLLQLGQEANIRMVAYYHLVPNPQNLVMEKVFERGMPDNYLIASDGTWFNLPEGSSEIIVTD